MGRNTKRMMIAVITGTLAAAGLAGCGGLDGTKTAATVGEEEISMGMLSFMTRYQQAQTNQLYLSMMGTDASSMWDQVEDEEEGTTYGDSLRDDALKQLEEMCLLKAHAEEYDVSVTDEEQEKIEKAAAQFMEDNDEQTQESLAVTQEDIEKFLELTTYYQKMQEPVQADVDTEVSDEEAAQTAVTYVKVAEESTEDSDEETSEDTEEEDKAAVTDEPDARTKAQEILDQTLASAEGDMDAIAKSVDENLSASSQSYSTNDEEDETVPQALKDAVSGLQDGEVVSSLVEDEGSYYIVRLDKAFDEEATESQKDTIISERKQQLYDDTVEKWRDEADIKENKGNIKKLKVESKDKYSFKAAETTEETAEE